MNEKLIPANIILLLVGALLFGFPRVSATQAKVPVRELAPVEAATSYHFGGVLSVRPLKNGGILVNDAGRRQLIVLDPTLSTVRVLLDSISVRGMSYGPFASPVIPYIADSSLFVDAQSLALLKISPQGEFAGVMSTPKPSDLRFLASSASGSDPSGNLLYRGGQESAASNVSQLNVALKALLSAPDSLPVVRANLETRSIDTLGRVRAPNTQRVTTSTDALRTVITVTINPLTELDEWAVLSDGTVVIVRGHDYHVDVLRFGKSWISGPKLPFARRRLSDMDKQALIDSARSDRDHREATQRLNNMTGSAITAANSNGEITRVRIRGTDQSTAPPAIATVLKTEFVAASEIPDYWPVLRSGAVLADMDNHVWILTTPSTQYGQGGLIFDVVDNGGEMIQRVRIPVGRSVAGFGRNGVVYLTRKDGVEGWAIERTKVLKP